MMYTNGIRVEEQSAFAFLEHVANGVARPLTASASSVFVAGTRGMDDWPCVVAGSGLATEQRVCSSIPRRAPLAQALPSSAAESGNGGARCSMQTPSLRRRLLATVRGVSTHPRTAWS